jgi:hypothetical protein
MEKQSMKVITSVNYISLANIFNALANFEAPKFSSQFYEKCEFKIIEIVNEIPFRAIANILRGYATFNYGSEILYKAIEKRVINELKEYNLNAKNDKDIDNESFSTVLYMFAKDNKGSAEFY